jgi:hypothetical protein
MGNEDDGVLNGAGGSRPRAPPIKVVTEVPSLLDKTHHDILIESKT